MSADVDAPELTLDKLDLRCNDALATIEDDLADLLAFDCTQVPSEAQRERLAFVQELLREAAGHLGVLRYDVSVTHEDCPYHDDWARRSLVSSRQRLAAAENAPRVPQSGEKGLVKVIVEHHHEVILADGQTPEDLKRAFDLAHGQVPEEARVVGHSWKATVSDQR